MVICNLVFRKFFHFSARALYLVCLSIGTMWGHAAMKTSTTREEPICFCLKEKKKSEQIGFLSPYSGKLTQFSNLKELDY